MYYSRKSLWIKGGIFSITGLTFGVIIGRYLERYKDKTLIERLPRRCTIEEHAALPTFGTVSAAIPTSQMKTLDTSDLVAENTAIKTGRIMQIMKFGFPGLDNVKSFDDFVLSYDQRNRVAHWVFEHLTRDSVRYNKEVDRSKCDFKEDPSIHQYFRASNLDYKGSGFDRGHLAAAGNHRKNQKDVEQTFFLSNITPQVGVGFNRDIWNDLEKYARNLTKKYPNVYVCTGPLFLPKKESDGKTYVKYQVIGGNNVAVPTHFFKIIVMENAHGLLEMEAFVMPNKVIQKDTPLKLYQVPPESIERASGLLFFTNLSRAKLISINGKSIK